MITNSLSRPKLPLIALFFAVFLHGGAISLFGQSGSLYEKRLELGQKLDSLEVEKQELKRQGRAIATLERATDSLRDSLSALRRVPASETKTASKSSPLSLRPRNTFDRIIIGIGLIAALSGIILIIGILRNRREKRKRMTYTYSRKLETVNKPSAKASSSPTEDEAQKPIMPPSNLHQSPEPSPTARKADSEVQHSEEDLISTLRDRLSQEESKEKTGSEPPVVAHTPQESSMSFNDLVVKSAQEGLSVQDISRRYQLSIDQVTLILKMAKK
ncbi:MAG: hypothetical protein ACLFQB_08925 [Chitinispirillaceae bacterium]